MARVWTCQRVSGGVRCGHLNPRRKRKCEGCGKDAPKPSKPKHMAALELSYEHYIELNGGEHCGICGRGPTEQRRLDRDHDHKTGEPRGLLCSWCNRRLDNRVDADWLRAAARYLTRSRLTGRPSG